MKSTRLVIFENSTANFRLSIDTMLTKTRPDGSDSDLVFMGKDNRTGTFRPSVFLVFTYLTDDYTTTQGIYTSFAHMYRIRSMFQEMHDIVTAQDAYLTVNGELTTNSKYSQSLLLDKIGKNNDWISLTLSRYKDPNSVQYFPAVALQISKSNGYSSLLTETEFESIYDVIMHLDLVNLENQAVILELVSRLGLSGENSGASTNSYQPQRPSYQPRQNGGNHYNAGPITDHRYGSNQNYSYSAQSASQPLYQQNAPRPQPTSMQVPPIPQRNPAPVAAPAPKAEEAPKADPTITESPTQTNSPSKPKVSMSAVSQMHVDDVDMSLDDSKLIDNIFAEADTAGKPESDSGNN